MGRRAGDADGAGTGALPLRSGDSATAAYPVGAIPPWLPSGFEDGASTGALPVRARDGGRDRRLCLGWGRQAAGVSSRFEEL